ncbi:SCO4225 family membrane protein [Streptomyces sp. NPDC008163]|uniref:SCO4225 family membrane protein n=1 Tax=Streptomyces sp. NPDC008163 TaxID=3364818 RepID=UPI0036E50B65
MNKPAVNQRTIRTLARLTFGNAASLLYLGAVAAATVFVTVDTLLVSHADASFAGVWLFLLAAPTVFLFLLGGSLGGAESFGPAWFMYLALAVSVLVQSLALGWFVRLLSGGARRSRTVHPHGA